jgi:riboflavin kinase / FMN adenylyltransferase
MQIIKSLEDFPKDVPVSLCIGNFDGIHLGHLDIIKKCKEKGDVVTVITFDKHPRVVLHPDYPTRILTLKHEKYSFFKELGINYLLELPFSKYCQSDPLDFLETLDKNLSINSITVGFNFFFGKDQKGNSDLLYWWGRSSGVKINVLPPTVKNGIRISSTAIRELIVSGQVEKAVSMMSFPFVLSGEVVKGRQLGREMNFPTLNFQLPDKIIPPDGVYITQTVIGADRYASLTNIGRSPTIDDEAIERKIETWVVDRSLESLYGRCASVYFFKKIRNEIKFSSREMLYNKVVSDKDQFLKFWDGRKIEELPDTYECF